MPSDAVTFEQLGTLLGHVPPDRLRAIRRAIYGRSERTKLLFMLLARGELRRWKPCLRVRGFERLRALVAQRTPAVLLSWHTGPYRAVGAALYVDGFDPLVVERRAIAHSAAVPLERVSAEGEPWRATAALKAAVDRLRGGGLVLWAGDGYEGATGGGEVEILGRRVVFRQGLATLVRLSGAPPVGWTAIFASIRRSSGPSVYESSWRRRPRERARPRRAHSAHHGAGSTRALRPW